MNDVIKETVKGWLPDSWEKVLSEVEDQKNIELVLLDLIKQCMPADDFELFSLLTKIHNNLIDEEQEEEEIENYIANHDLGYDFDFMEEDFPLSRFKIDFNKFSSLILERYNWIFNNSYAVSDSNFMPIGDISCDTYITIITNDIYVRFNGIKSSITYKYNEKIKEEAISILNRKWEDITGEDYQKAIEMLKSVNAINELIEVLSTGVYIKGDNGWKVKRSNKIEALKIEENAVKTDNITLKDWVDLLLWDYNSGMNPENTHQGILEKLYNEGSGLAALILGDYKFKLLLGLISGGIMTQDWSDWRYNAISETLRLTMNYYKTAAERNCAIGYRVCALIYYVLGDKDKSESFEQDYQKSPYDYKRSAFNLLRDYNKELEWEKENGFRFTKNYLEPAPLSIIALDEQKAKKYLKRKFQGFDLSLLSLS